MKTRVKGTMILKKGGRFFKVIAVRGTGNNWHVFGSMDIDSKQRQVFTYKMLGLLVVMDATAYGMRPQRHLLVDWDNHGKWKIVSKDEIDRMSRS